MRYIIDNLYGILKKNDLDNQLAENEIVYKYGIELLISSLVGYLIVMFEGIILNIPFEAVIFCLTFTTLRIYAGGYHAETYLKCNIIFSACCFITFLIYKYSFIYVNWFCIVAIGLLNLLILSKYVPIINHNKILNNERIKKCRKRFKIFLSIVITVLVITYKAKYYPGIIIIYAILLVDILIIVVIGGKRYGKKSHN